jgi:sugar-phosphatase
MVTVECAGLLFDNDGVIVDSTPSVNRSWRRFAAAYGVPNAALVEIAHGTRAVDIMQTLVPGIDQVEGLKLIDAIELADLGDVKILPGVKQLLESLPKDRWTIVSSATAALLAARLNVAGVPLPDRMVSGDQVTKGKPDPEPYLKGAENLGFHAADCVVIEDAPSGVKAGKAAGCRVLGMVETHTAEQLREAGADWVVASMEDVAAGVVGDGLRLELRTLQVQSARV